MATWAKLTSLHLQSVSNSPKWPKEIEQLTQSIQKLINSIHSIIRYPENSNSREFNGLLMDLSNFFNTQKYSTTILPVLKQLQDRNPDNWKDMTTIRDGKEIALTPDSFENISKEDQARELALLKIFWIQIDVIYRAQRILKRNQDN